MGLTAKTEQYPYFERRTHVYNFEA